MSWIPLISFLNYSEAHIVAGMLNNEGILTTVKDNMTIESYTGVFCKPHVIVNVQNQQFNVAAEILVENGHEIIDQSIVIHIGLHLINENDISKIAQALNTKIAGKMKRPSSYLSDLGIGYTDSYWDGTHGVLSIHDLEFSEKYNGYGIQKFDWRANS